MCFAKRQSQGTGAAELCPRANASDDIVKKTCLGRNMSDKTLKSECGNMLRFRSDQQVDIRIPSAQRASSLVMVKSRTLREPYTIVNVLGCRLPFFDFVAMGLPHGKLCAEIVRTRHQMQC